MTETHDCNQNIESNMAPAHCSVCGKSLKETPTRKGVEEVVAEFGKQFDELGMKPPKNSMPGMERELLKFYLRQTLLARDAAADARLREVITEIIVFAQSGNFEALDVAGEVKAIAACHGITNL